MVLLLLACSDYRLDEQKEAAPVDSAPVEDTSPADTADTAPPPEETGDTAPPPPEEECNGEDDDGDGAIDEDFPDTDADGTADCRDAEECDDVDNDGDGETDEGFDLDTDGIPDCDEVDHTVKVTLTADDAWNAWIDGVDQGGLAWWSTAGHIGATLDSGPHVIAVHAWDLYGQPSGFMAAAWVDDALLSVTGDGSWVYTRTSPAAGWELVPFDDSGWTTPDVCTGGWWGTSPTELWSVGAVMTWEGDCTGVGEAWYRLDLDLP